MNLRKFLVAGLTAVMMSGFGALASSAANVPNIQVRSNGAENEYEVTLQNMSSSAYGVQFDLTVDSDKDVTVNWADGNSGNIQKAVQTDNSGKTKITFYLSKQKPLSNSSSVQIATIVTDREMNNSSFETSGYMKTVNQNQRANVYQNISLDSKLTPDVPGGDGGSDNSSGGNNKPSDTNKPQQGGSNKPSGGQQTNSAQTNSSQKVEINNVSAQKMLSWKDLSSQVKTVSGKKTLEIAIQKGQLLSADVLRTAIEQKIAVTLDYGNYRWILDGSSGGNVPDKQKSYDFSLEMLSQSNLSIAAENSDLMQFAVGYQGKMPCEASLVVPIGAEYAGQTLYLAQYDELEATLRKTGEAVVSEDGNVRFLIENAGKYIITTKDLWKSDAKTEENATLETTQTVQSGEKPSVSDVAVTVPPMMTQEELDAQAAAEEEDIASVDEATEPSVEESQPDENTQTAEKPHTAMIAATVAVVVLFGAVVVFLFVKMTKSSRTK